MSTTPSVTPAAPKRSGPGCVVLAVLFPVVILAGIVVGTVLDRPDDADEERSVTIADGTTSDGTEWRVDAVRDIEGDTCAFLFEGDEQLTGGCALTPDDATFGDETVVFGKAASDTTTVRVVLNTGTVVEIDTVEADGISGRYYAKVVEGDVDAVSLARL
ncbi:MAG: hypothetical protein ACRDZU_10635 [Acidimicrobiales bacterium]